MQVALLLQRAELVRDAGGAGQPDSLADFPHRRRVAALLHRLPDDLKYLALPPGQDVIRIGLVRGFRYDDRDAALRLAPRPVIRSGHLGNGSARSGTCCGGLFHLHELPVHLKYHVLPPSQYVVSIGIIGLGSGHGMYV